MEIYGSTDKGLCRSINQDCYEITKFSQSSAFALVCDGMGGANAGNIASKIASDTISKYIKASYSKNLSEANVENLLRSAVISANIAVFEAATENQDFKGMGTTVVLALIHNGKAFIAHVGDSRAYLYKNQKAEQITVDHSVVQTLIDIGQITADEAKTHPKKNIITRALGVNSDVSVDINICDFDSDTVLLLCSDGLSNYTELSKITDELSTADSSVAERLIAAANKGGGGDNITAVVFIGQ